VAFDWKVRKNIAQGKGEKGSMIIHFKEAFHGRSGYTMSLTNTEIKKTLYFPQFKWPRISNPKLSFKNGAVSEEVIKQVIEAEKKSIEEIENACKEHGDDIAALIVEPIQGEGGDNHFRGEFLHELRRLADKHDFLLIFDEVQSGFGTSGKCWSFQHFGVLPDLFVFGKKTQTCGIAAQRNRLDEVDNVFKVSSRINSTWGGSLVDMIRCQKIIEIIEEDNLLDNARDVGAVILAGLSKLEERFPVSNARGRGMFIAIDLPDTKLRDAAIRSLADHNILVLASGTRSLRVRPALSMSKEEGLEMVKRFEKTFSDMWPANN